MNKRLTTTEEENLKFTERVKELEKEADIMAADLKFQVLGLITRLPYLGSKQPGKSSVKINI